MRHQTERHCATVRLGPTGQQKGLPPLHGADSLKLGGGNNGKESVKA